MTEGILGFPRLTDLGPFTSTGSQDISSELKNSINKFNLDFDIEDSNGDDPYYKWEDSPGAGVTGLWLKNRGVMVIEPRGTTTITHGDMHDTLTRRFGDIEFIPWSSMKSRQSLSLDKGWFLDSNSVAGSIGNPLDANRDYGRIDASPHDVWGIIYTAWVTNHPYDTVITHNYTRRYSTEEYKDTFVLANGYRELSFELNGLPEPEINRTS